MFVRNGHVAGSVHVAGLAAAAAKPKAVGKAGRKARKPATEPEPVEVEAEDVKEAADGGDDAHA